MCHAGEKNEITVVIVGNSKERDQLEKVEIDVKIVLTFLL